MACGGSPASTVPAGLGAKPGIATAPGMSHGSSTSSQPGGARSVVTDVVPPIAEGPRVIRTAQISVEVGNGTFDSTLDQLYAITRDFGGYISGTSATAITGSLRSGTITFQVPADKFDLAVRAVRGLGKVQNFNIGGQDVSSQYVDVQARLRNAEAQREAMLALLGKANTIQEIILVQNQIGQTTAQIEQLRGQINYLDHATTYSTVAVNIHEVAVVVKPTTGSIGLNAAFSDAGRGFVNTLAFILVGLGDAGPILILLGLGLVAWRLRRRITQAMN